MLIGMNVKQGFQKTFVIGIAIAMINFILGFMVSLWFDLPTGSVIVMTYAVLWFLSVTMIPMYLRRKR
jgi:ABC-type Mn2+/Zn2+ transport system permease subunit